MFIRHSALMPTIPKHQSGVVLAICLIILLVLTLIGVTSSNVTGLEEKMAANTKDVNLAFQAAEAALRDVETNILKTKPSFQRSTADTAQGTGTGIYTYLTECNGTETTSATPRTETTPSIRPFYNTVDWNATSNIKYKDYDNVDKVSGSSKKLNGLSQLPRYIIEEIDCKQIKSGSAGGSLGATKVKSTPKADVMMIRITARGWGSNTNSTASVQSIVKVTYEN